MEGLKDKIVLVAGAATGLGADSARRLAREGAKVVVGDLDGDGASRTAASIVDEGGQALAAQFDISDDDSVRTLVSTVVQEHGGLDAVHVNAGDMGRCATTPMSSTSTSRSGIGRWRSICAGTCS